MRGYQFAGVYWGDLETGVTNHRWSMWVIKEPLGILVEKIKWARFSLTVTASDIGLREPVQKSRC